MNRLLRCYQTVAKESPPANRRPGGSVAGRHHTVSQLRPHPGRLNPHVAVEVFPWERAETEMASPRKAAGRHGPAALNVTWPMLNRT